VTLSAIIEGCLLGDRSEIGKKSKVKNCKIGPKMQVKDGENLEEDLLLE
jgi:carbonic anhydrase/acetyltransferase-like protein (isoleucine patch superfamily)